MPALECARHEEFCNQLLMCGFNGTAAVRATKYSHTGCSVTANRLLSYPNVRKRIGELMAERCERVKIDSDLVLKEAVKCYKECIDNGDYSIAERYLKQAGLNVNVNAFAANINISRGKELEDLSDDELEQRLQLMAPEPKDDDSVVVTYDS